MHGTTECFIIHFHILSSVVLENLLSVDHRTGCPIVSMFKYEVLKNSSFPDTAINGIKSKFIKNKDITRVFSRKSLFFIFLYHSMDDVYIPPV